jgi:hypothetical protein
MANLAEKINQLQRLIQDSIPEATLIALNTMLGAYSKRIFEFGLDSNNLKIGFYSSKPMLTGGKSFRTKSDANAFFAQKQKWVTVKTATGLKKLAVVPGGYREFRALNKLQNQFVDLNFTGALFFSVVVGNKDGVPVLGFNNFAQYEKAKKLEAKYKTPIFNPTQEEIKIAREAFNDFMKEKIQQLFSSW